MIYLSGNGTAVRCTVLVLIVHDNMFLISVATHRNILCGVHHVVVCGHTICRKSIHFPPKEMMAKTLTSLIVFPHTNSWVHSYSRKLTRSNELTLLYFCSLQLSSFIDRPFQKHVLWP